MMNLREDLVGSKNVKEEKVVTDIDLVAAAEELAEATIAFTEAETNMTVLTNAYEALVYAEELKAERIAKGYEDADSSVDDEMLTVVAVGKTLGLGNEDIDAVTTGYEESKVSNFIKNIWEGIKKIAAKIWKALNDVINAMVNFVAGLFGKGMTTSEKIQKIVSDLEEGKKTEKSADKLEKEVAQDINKRLQSVLFTDNALTAKTIVKNLERRQTIEESAPANEATLKAVELVKNFSASVNDPEKLKEINKELVDAEVKAQSDLEKLQGKAGLDKVLSKYIEVKKNAKYLISEINDGYVNITEVLTDEDKDGMINFSKVSTLKLTAQDSDLKNDVKVLSIDEMKTLQKAFEEQEKIAQDVINEAKKMLEGSKKLISETDKMFDNAVKEIDKIEDKDVKVEVQKTLKAGLDLYRNVTSKIYPKQLKGIVATAKGVVDSKVVDYVKASASVYAEK